MATVVKGNPKAPFSIATTPRCRGGRYSFPGLLYFTLDPYLIMLSVKQGGIKDHFLSLWYARPGIEPRSPGPLANTLTARPMSGHWQQIQANNICFYLLYIALPCDEPGRCSRQIHLVIDKINKVTTRKQAMHGCK